MILQNFDHHLSNDRIYKPDQIEEVITEVRKNFRFSQVNTKHRYFNVPAAFDIETSSFYDKDGNKCGLMYAWAFGLYGLVIIGRTWKQFTKMIKKLCSILNLSDLTRLIVYVHNLQFDFQFFRSHFNFEKVFASDHRQPLYALTDSGLEFRCSYMLSGLSLEKVGENLLKYIVKKKVGDLDYSLIRHAETPLKPKESGYIASDVKVAMAYVAEEIENYNGIANLPLTKTGYVRKYCRNFCYTDPETGKADKKRYYEMRDLMHGLKVLDAAMYHDMKNCFAGGFTHCNDFYAKKMIGTTKNCDVKGRPSSWDFTSAYPAVMIAERFPMSTPIKPDCTEMSKEQFEHYNNNYCTMFTISFYDLKEKPDAAENYISKSKCLKISKDARINNGRVVSASFLEVTITNVDLEIIDWLYDYREFDFAEMYVWKKDYLPRDFMLAILELYKGKTELKGVDDKKAEYMVKKGMANAAFGMAVTDIVPEVNPYEEGEWQKPYKPDIETEIEKYNNQRKRFLYYPWGIFVTCYNRRNLFTGIIEAGMNDYIYSDTDSIKILNTEKHREYFENYNREILQKLEYALEYRNIDKSYIYPKTIKGEVKPLGVWDFEGYLTRFKSLGAKRYMLVKDRKLELTVSGLNKKTTVPYLRKKFKTHDKIFEAFNDGLEIPAGKTGKMTHTYIDIPRSGLVTDYRGQTIEFEELTSIHLENAAYDLKMDDFNAYLLEMGGI